MPFNFEIIRIHKLPSAHIAVLEGKLIAGVITSDSSADLVHDNTRRPIHVKGVVMASVRAKTTNLHVTVTLNQDAMDVIAVGDKIVCNK